MVYRKLRPEWTCFKWTVVLEQREGSMLFRSQIAACIAVNGLLFLGVCPLSATDTSSNSKHCLWRITNARAPFYLLGSVHSLQRTDYERVPLIEEVIKQSQQIWFEVDPKEDQAFAKKLGEAARLPRGQQILGKISPKTYNYLRKITISGLAEWQHLYPWAIAMFLEYPNLRGVSSIYGVDYHVEEMARRYSKATGGLETVDEHIRVLSDMHMIEGEVFLLQALVHAGEASQLYQEEVAAWKKGRLQATLRNVHWENERSPNRLVAVA
jgi:uncharacterized protein YbaP (TraB family)